MPNFQQLLLLALVFVLLAITFNSSILSPVLAQTWPPNPHYQSNTINSNTNIMPNNKTNRMQVFITSRRVVSKKHEESLCPVEYRSCSCDYINPAGFDGGGGENGDVNIKFRGGGGTRSAAELAIMIDCQVYSGGKFSGKVLDEIPKLERGNMVTKSKYLDHITHLDLSRTEISEVQKDAFQGLRGLQTIVITYCKSLKTIRRFAFRNLPNLKTLIVSNNPNLVTLEEYSFGSLFNLNYLSLTMNQLSAIDGYIFSASTSIRIIDFIGNPIKRIKSHAFHGLRNVSDLLLSLKQNKSPIEVIEDDSFITTAFVDQIFLEGIPCKQLQTNAFRGLSHCKHLYLTHTHIEEIHADAFLRANHIKRLSLMNSRVRNVSKHAFRGIFNVDTIDLRGNYLTKLNASTFEELIAGNQMSINVGHQIYSNQSSSDTGGGSGGANSIVFIDTERTNSYVVRKILFEQNPIQCDCSLVWIFKNKVYLNSVSLPELCSGPKGFDCLRISELGSGDLICPNKSISNFPCDDLVFDVDKGIEIYSISAPKGKKKSSIFGETTTSEDDDLDSDEYNNSNQGNDDDPAPNAQSSRNPNTSPPFPSNNKAKSTSTSTSSSKTIANFLRSTKISQMSVSVLGDGATTLRTRDESISRQSKKNDDSASSSFDRNTDEDAKSTSSVNNSSSKSFSLNNSAISLLFSFRFVFEYFLFGNFLIFKFSNLAFF